MSLLAEFSLSQLIQQTASAYPATTKRENAVDEVSVSHVHLVPAENTLVAKGTVRGSAGKTYECAIHFENVQYNPGPDEPAATFVSGGQEYTIVPIQTASADVQVSCSCLDFRFRFAHYNSSSGALFGKQPDLYARVPNSKRPEANPKKSPGVCKHLIDFTNSLTESGLLE